VFREPCRTLKPWEDKINRSYQKGVLAWLETGRTLLEAKDKLGHGRFQFMVTLGNLPFNKRMAEMFMSIARNRVLSNAQHVALLPGAMSTLYELSRIEPEILEAKIIDGTITPQLQRAEVKSKVSCLPPPAHTTAEPDPPVGVKNQRR
jgi:hypothetical protein